MPFDILKVPFYLAVSLFEQQKYQAAFDILVECALKGNLYAPYYLNYLLESESKNLKIADKYTIFLKELKEYLKRIPTEQKPEFWVKASLCIMKLNANGKAKIERRLITELETYIKYASNAGIALLNWIQQNIPNSEKYKKLMVELYSKGDLFTIYHLNKNDKILKPSYMQKEWACIEKFATLAYKHQGGDLERLLAKYYDGPELIKSSPFEQDFSRKYDWQISGAYMGNKEMQGMFSQANKQNIRTKEELERWGYQAAYHGERQSEILYGLSCSLKKNHEEGRRFLERALKNPGKVTDYILSQAYLQLGKITEEGWGKGEQDKKQALEYYVKAESLGNAWGARNVGVFYQNGLGGLEKNVPKAIHQYKKALELSKEGSSEEEIANIKLLLAEIYFSGGVGVEVNYKKAAELYKQTQNYDLNAAGNYATMLISGQGVDVDQCAGMHLLIKTAKQGHALSAYHVVQMYVSKNIVNREQYKLTEEDLLGFMKTIESSDKRTGLNMVYSLLYFHHLPSGPNYKMAYEYLMKGLQNREPDALTRMGNLYEYGCPELKIEKDQARAYQYYSEAADLGDPTAMNNKAYFLFNGFSVEKNLELAKTLFEKSLEKECLIAAYGLSCLHSIGKYRDEEKIFSYLKMAESTQDEDVLYHLGNCYHLATGVAQDLKKACEYYQVAYANGSCEAGHNYCLIQLNLGLETGKLTESVLKEILERFKYASDQGYVADTFMYHMIRLLLDPVLISTGFVDPSLIRSVTLDLKALLEKKSHRRTKEVIEYFGKNNSISILDILLFITVPRHESIPLKKLEQEQKETKETKKNRELSPKTNLEAQAQTEMEEAKRKKMDRLKREIAWFTDPKQIKSINLKEFNHLLGKMAASEEFILETRHSKGSNIQYRVQELNDKTLCFSYHPTHKSGSTQDSEFDPNRAKSLQSVIKNIASSMNS